MNDHTPADDVHTIRWGYNLADLDRLSRLATSGAVGGAVGLDAYQTAWDGLVDHLLNAQTRPDPADMLNAARHSLSRRARETEHHHGRHHRYDGQAAPRFMAYWDALSRRSHSPEEKVVEKITLWQIWPTLTPGQREVLLALAVHEDYARAAQALGKNPRTFNVLISQGRNRFRALWHEGETPSRQWGMDRRRTNTGTKAEATYRKARRNMLRRGATA